MFLNWLWKHLTALQKSWKSKERERDVWASLFELQKMGVWLQMLTNASITTAHAVHFLIYLLYLSPVYLIFLINRFADTGNWS